MKFISYIGTQLFSIINPLVSLIKAGYVFDSIIFLPTEMTLPEAKKIKNFVIKEFDIDDVFEIIKIPRKVPVATIKDLMKAEEFIFNINGGLNYQIAQTIGNLDIEYFRNGKFAYSDNSILSLYENLLSGKEKRIYYNIHSIDIMKIFSLNNLKIRHYSDKHSGLSSQIMQVIHIPFDFQKLYNVHIDDVVFDIVANINNTIYFFKEIKDYSKEEIRSLIRFSDDIIYKNNFFHKEVYVVTQKSSVRERIISESSGKIKIFNRENFINFLKPQYRKSKLKITTKEKSFRIKSNNRRIVTFLGKNILPTINAINSMSAENVTVFYTLELKKTAKRLDNVLFYNKLELVEVDFYCNKLLNYKPTEKTQDTFVNVTPGTKLQLFFLCIWALKNNGVIVTIKDRQHIVDINDRKISEINSFNLSDYFKAKNLTLKKGYLDNKKLNEKSKIYEKWKEEIIHKLFSKKELFKWRKENKDGYDFQDGFWFEEFAAYIIMKTLQTSVWQQVRTDWSWNKEKADDIFKTDIDIVVSYSSIRFVIDCKTGIEGLNSIFESKILEFKKNIAAVSEIFGKFAIPMLCYFDNFEDDYSICQETGVVLFGIKILLNPDKLKNMFDEVLLSKSTFDLSDSTLSS